MIKKLKPVPIHGNQAIIGILNDGFDSFKEVIKRYCSQNGSQNTILGWGGEKTYLSIFCQGLINKDRGCFLEMAFDRAGKRKGKYNRGMVDAFLYDRSMSNKTLTSVIEAKAVFPYISEKPSEGNILRTKEALEDAKDQLRRINRKDIYSDEEKGSKKHIYRIALIFTVLRARFAESGDGEKLNFYKYNVLQSRAEEFFENIENKIKGRNIRHDKYIHSIPQLKLIKEYYGHTMPEDDEDRPYKHTYYEVGALVTAAIFL